MTIRADSDHRFYYRFIFIGLTLLGMAGWFLYDGAVTYPKQFDRAHKYEELLKEGKVDQWPTVATENGWPTDKPKNEIDSQIQYIFAGILGALGLWCLLIVWLARGRWIEGTKTGIMSSWGQSLNFDDVISLDKKQWRKKGVAKITYQDGNRRRRFVIDDYKFEREATGQILRNLEDRLSPEQIVGGPSEAEAEQQAEFEAVQPAE
jgi:hypothetical protein